jgi:preprotein translocase subunit SecA
LVIREIASIVQGDSSGSAHTDRQELIRNYHYTGMTNESCAALLRYTGLATTSALGISPRRCQYEAAAALLNQELAEMDTGEGKSLVVAMAAAAAAMTGTPVHVMTVNDYLAHRDATYFAGIFKRCGLRVSHIPEGQQPTRDRQDLYSANVCYGTAKSFAFDYLRDQRHLSRGPVSQLQSQDLLLNGLCFAIVDEADSIFLDEAMMPLVLSTPVRDADHRARLWQASDLAQRLTSGQHFHLANRVANLTEDGEQYLQSLVEKYDDRWRNRRYRTELIVDALAARHCYREGIDYIAKNDTIQVVDQTTGRAVPGRQFPGQLHGMIALKHRLEPAARTETSSGLTYPRYFDRYHHLCGLSGTLSESSRELKQLYGLDVHRIARNEPSQATRLPGRVFESESLMFESAAARATELARGGRPVLIGTDSVRDSDRLAAYFAAHEQSVTVMNALNDKQEAELIRLAGRDGNITIATQVAGRGTDIQLQPAALNAGGLHVINLQHNRSARIDRQMIGRAARQADPGSSEHWLCLANPRLATDSLPPAIATTFRISCRIGLVRLGQALIRQFWRAEDRLTRANRLRADRNLSKQLHFSSMANQ